MKDKCRVRGCKRDADVLWEPLMNLHGAEVPVCLHHFRHRLWWYRGWIFDRDEEEDNGLSSQANG
jgi:hypothetical protein